MSNEYEGWFLEWIEEWSQFFETCNWYTFHPIKIEFENDSSMGALEATIIIAGLGFRWRWNHTATEKVAEIQQAVEEIKAGRAWPEPVDLG